MRHGPRAALVPDWGVGLRQEAEKVSAVVDVPDACAELYLPLTCLTADGDMHEELRTLHAGAQRTQHGNIEELQGRVGPVAAGLCERMQPLRASSAAEAVSQVPVTARPGLATAS